MQIPGNNLIEEYSNDSVYQQRDFEPIEVLCVFPLL